MFAAAALDQLAMIGTFMLFIWFGVLISASFDDLSGAARGFAIGVGILVVVVGIITANVRIAVRLGSTVGLFLLGARFDPRERVRWDDASEWFLTFWPSLVLAPLAWIVGRFGAKNADKHSGVTRDPRAQSGETRVLRAVLAIVVLALPVPLLVTIFS